MKNSSSQYRSDPYEKRPSYFQKISPSTWSNWLWQQQQAVRNSSQLKKIFPHFLENQLHQAKEWEKRGFRFLLTPYTLSLVEKNSEENPITTDPIWRQIFPAFEEFEQNESLHSSTKFSLSVDEYSSQKENWENPEEMITPIAQHKYKNRVIIYTIDSCLGYCVYCFRSLQSNASTEKHGGHPHWQETLEALRERPQVEEVILSGGDPLLFDNVRIENMLQDLRRIPSIKAIRIHTRAWLHNPFRIDEAFCTLLKKYQVTEMGVHIVHPNEISTDFQAAIQRIRNSGARTQLMTDTPLIKNVNDDTEILNKLFMDLYISGVKPYYLSHNMPNIPAAASQRTSVRRGLEIYLSLKRHISNTAMPEYIICHRSGKKTVPEALEGTPDFIYDKEENGWPIVKFRNWKGQWEIYLDSMND